MTIENCFNIRGAVKEEIEKQVKEYIGSVYEQGYENGYEQGKKESNNKLYKLYQELSDAYKTIYSLERNGHWIFVDNTHEHARCSECGYGNVDLFDGKTHNYCPNCGADMREESE